jgi:hypothetical protein
VVGKPSRAPILRQGHIYPFKRSGKHARIEAVGNYGVIGHPETYHYTVWIPETDESYDQNEHALVPQLRLGG